MKSFIVALLVLTFVTSTYASYSPMIDLGLVYAQQTLGFNAKCFTDLQKIFEVGVELYEAFTSGNSGNLVTIVMKALPIL